MQPTLARFLCLGLALGIGYWIKAVLLPLGMASLLLAFFWISSASWRRGLILAACLFVCVSAPLITILSLQKHRLTFGDSGRVNYAWVMACGPDVTIERNWQGDIPAAGTPVHGTRLIVRQPPVFEFSSPVAGTYPPWTDPSYWNEGLRVHFQLARQLQVLSANFPREARLLFRSEPALLVAVVTLLLIGGRFWFTAMRELWPLLCIQGLGFFVYAVTIVNDRYLGGFALLLFVLLIGGARFHNKHREAATCLVLAVSVALVVGIADLTLRTVTHHFAIPGNGPSSTLEDEVFAENLLSAGVPPGERFALIGDGTGAYWARLGRFRIVAEIMGMNHGAEQFWASDQATREAVFNALAKPQARYVVSSCPVRLSSDWRPISGTRFCVRPLDSSRPPSNAVALAVGGRFSAP